MNKKPTYRALELKNKKLEKEKFELEVKLGQTLLKLDLKELTTEHKNTSIARLREQLYTLSDERTSFKCERAELTLALVEVINSTELEVAKEIAKEAIKHIHSTIKLEPNHPF